MLDCVVRNEGQPDVVQISGGEPTIHPEFFAILDAAKARPIRHLMVNTNGIRIAQERGVRASGWRSTCRTSRSTCSSTRSSATRSAELRGADLRDGPRAGARAAERHGISTTLVVTLKKGLNDDEIGEIIDFALEQPCVRGVTFQPIQAAGRIGRFRPGHATA